MSAFGFGSQGDWYAWATLLMKVAFLIAGVWFAGNLLKIIRAFQEQVGALLRLSITATPTEQPSASAVAKRALGEASTYRPAETHVRVTESTSPSPNRLEASPYGSTPPETQSVGSVAETMDTSATGTEGRAYRFMPPERQTAHQTEAVDGIADRKAGGWRRVGHWLSGPMSVSEVTPDATPWRRMIHWLQVPARS